MHSSKRTIGTDDAFSLLAASERRTVIRHLVKSDGAATITELAGEIETRRGTASRTESDRTAISTALYHVHLPKLAHAGIVDVDQRNGDVVYYSDDRLERLLDTAASF